jgi:hypothetical protein
MGLKDELLYDTANPNPFMRKKMDGLKRRFIKFFNTMFVMSKVSIPV